jgi:hypothetical protein
MSYRKPNAKTLSSLRHLLIDKNHAVNKSSNNSSNPSEKSVTLPTKLLADELNEIEGVLKEDDIPTLDFNENMDDDIPTLNNISSVSDNSGDDWVILRQQLLEQYEMVLKTSLEKTRHILLTEYTQQLDKLQNALQSKN